MKVADVQANFNNFNAAYCTSHYGRVYCAELYNLYFITILNFTLAVQNSIKSLIILQPHYTYTY